MKIFIPLFALAALSGCAASLPVCQPEDPAYVRELQRCLAAAPEARKFLLEGYDLRNCREGAGAKGLYARNTSACLDPKLHGYLIRERQGLAR